MKLAVIIYSKDPETVWNALRLANTGLIYDDDVTVLLLGQGVETAEISSLRYNVKEQLDLFRAEGGKLVGCGVCCDNREDEMPLLKENLSCDMGSMQDLYAIVKDFDRVITF